MDAQFIKDVFGWLAKNYKMEVLTMPATVANIKLFYDEAVAKAIKKAGVKGLLLLRKPEENLLFNVTKRLFPAEALHNLEGILETKDVAYFISLQTVEKSKWGAYQFKEFSACPKC